MVKIGERHADQADKENTPGVRWYMGKRLKCCHCTVWLLVRCIQQLSFAI